MNGCRYRDIVGSEDIILSGLKDVRLHQWDVLVGSGMIDHGRPVLRQNFIHASAILSTSNLGVEGDLREGPAHFAIDTLDAPLAPKELIALHELLGQGVGPRAERKAGSDVTNGAVLRRSEAVHVCALTILVAIGRVGVCEPDLHPADVLVEVSRKIHCHPQRLLSVLKETKPAGHLAGNAIVEFSIDEVLIRSPSHQFQ